MRNDVVENKIMAKAKFLEWYKLDDATMSAMGHTNKYPVYISPDVLSLHIVWIIDGEAEHEIADYPDSYDHTEVVEWLETEIFDDCYGPVDYGVDAYEDIFNGQKIGEIPEINFVVEETKTITDDRLELLPGAEAQYEGRWVQFAKALRDDYNLGSLKGCANYAKHRTDFLAMKHYDPVYTNPQMEQIDTLRDLQRQMLDLLDNLKECRDEIERGGNGDIASRLSVYVIAHLECSITSEHDGIYELTENETWLLIASKDE